MADTLRDLANGTIGEPYRSPGMRAVGTLADLLAAAGQRMDHVGVTMPGWSPIAPGKSLTLKDMLIGDLARVLEDTSYGMGPSRGGNYATGGIGTHGLKPDALELLNAAPGAAVAGKGLQKGAKSLAPTVADMLRRKSETLADFVGSRKMAAPEPEYTGIAEQERLRRADEQGYKMGYYRGGKSVADGPHYTPDESAAHSFGGRHGEAKDVREYAIRMENVFRTRDLFTVDDVAPIAAAMKKSHPAIAKELVSLPEDWGGAMPGGMLWQVLETQTGGNAADILRSAGFKAVDAGQELYALDMSIIRDAKRAAFDPKLKNKALPFAALSGASVGAGQLTGLSFDDADR